MSKEKKDIVKLTAEDHIELSTLWNELTKIQYEITSKKDKIALNTETIKRIQAENGNHQRDMNALSGLFNTTKMKSGEIWKRLSEKYGVDMTTEGAYDPITWTWKSNKAIDDATKGGNSEHIEALDALANDKDIDTKEIN